MSDVVLSREEVQRLAGGYKRAKDQLRILHEKGYTRAWRSPVTGEVVLPRAHVDAVGAAEQKPERPRPKLRLA